MKKFFSIGGGILFLFFIGVVVLWFFGSLSYSELKSIGSEGGGIALGDPDEISVIIDPWVFTEQTDVKVSKQLQTSKQHKILSPVINVQFSGVNLSDNIQKHNQNDTVLLKGITLKIKNKLIEDSDKCTAINVQFLDSNNQYDKDMVLSAKYEPKNPFIDIFISESYLKKAAKKHAIIKLESYVNTVYDCPSF